MKDDPQGRSGAAWRKCPTSFSPARHLRRPAAKQARPHQSGLRVPSPASASPCSIPVRRSRRVQVTDTLRECRNALGDDILAIGAGIACSPYGEIDLIALDLAHQLTIVDVQTRLDDGMVARGLSHVDWAVRNLPIVQRLYPNWPIDMTRPPRLVLVAPRFSLALRSGIRQVASPAISCFRYSAVDLSGETGLLVERV